jgi:hypothetical protein
MCCLQYAAAQALISDIQKKKQQQRKWGYDHTTATWLWSSPVGRPNVLAAEATAMLASWRCFDHLISLLLIC